MWRQIIDTLKECSQHTGQFAWKVPGEAGAHLVLLKGDVKFKDVIFGYDQEKIILNNISLVCKAGTENRLCRLHRCREKQPSLILSTVSMKFSQA